MIILYVLLIAYILAVNFYAFLLVKSLRDKDNETETNRKSESLPEQANTSKRDEKFLGKLIITGALGGAITIYACMFIFKWRRSDLLLMILMPLLGVLNVYVFALLFRSGFRFFVIR